MSRYAFEEIVVNASALTKRKKKFTFFKKEKFIDSRGFTMSDWIDYGVIGWCDKRKSYFIHLDTNEDEIPWNLGSNPNEISSFAHLCFIINQIFSVKNGVLQFENCIERRDGRSIY